MSSPPYFGGTQTNIDSTLRSDVKGEAQLSDEGRSLPVSDVAEPWKEWQDRSLEEIRAISVVVRIACPAGDPERPLLDVELTCAVRRPRQTSTAPLIDLSAEPVISHCNYVARHNHLNA